MNFRNVIRALSSIAAAGIVIAATPAHANSTAAATQITGVVKSDSAAKGQGDREFNQLFANW